ncbi:MAG: leucyl aminopeptidase [Candidatus Margulisiibacteriota bacterium]|jgi:leucyl aminopeptidase
MKVSVKQADVVKQPCDLLFVNLFQDVTSPSGPTGAIDKALNGLITQLIKEKEIKGDLGKVSLIHTQGKIPARRVAVIGLGKPEKFKLDDLRQAGSVMADIVKKVQAEDISTVIHGVGDQAGIYPKEAAAAVLEGYLLGAYEFPGKKTKKEEEQVPVKSLTFVDNKEEPLRDILPALEYIQFRAEAVNKARALVEQPSNIVTPTYLANVAKEIAQKHKQVKVKVLDRKDLESMKAGAFLCVAAGAEEPPKMIILEYSNAKPGSDVYGLIGKGITFDSGGISIKPAKKMSEMKTDMAGAAAILAVVETVARLNLRVNILAVIPATENMPDARATKPGDIITALSGKTIEIISTDAEGRLVLADAITYAVQNGATKLIDIATLTGGCSVALGDIYSGIMGNDQLWLDDVICAGRKAGEKIWQLPFDKEYEDYLKSDVADILNCTEEGKASPVIGGIFLGEFAKNMPWAHIDIAGTAYLSKKAGCLNRGASGVGVRTLVELLKGKSE